MNGHVLVLGEALVDIVRRGPARPVEHVGGSPLNVAVGLGRLGRDVEFVTHIGDDDRGRRIVRHLADSSVRLAAGSSTAPRTPTATATLDENGAATYEFDLEWQLPDPRPEPGAGHVHTGSIAALLEPGCEAVAALLDRHVPTATISYDPNVRPALVGDDPRTRDRITRFVAGADVVKASDEDLRWFAPDRDPRDVAQEWLALGPALVAVTLGAGGAVAVARSGAVDVAAHPVEVVDTVGAGDAFMAGLLDALWTQELLGDREGLHGIEPDALRAALDVAARTAALTVARPGADLPTRGERDADPKEQR
ncbi:carbohydrate kinase [Rhodococcus ruber]|uniref:carbohydrate kinase family protein n=1 Tax=Rhodococcus TaxID=1827 RepID=UPI00029AD8D5|nr:MULTISPECIES: carbohydrate kinase [Rhodococcus]ATQ31342.1 carbohydrate kinase [Rhodococcus ruber]UIR37414.1 carbohydrate kinase [Rhodococcus sp. DMF-1]